MQLFSKISLKSKQNVWNFVQVLSGGLLGGIVASYCSGNEKVFKVIFIPFVHHAFNPERSHKLAVFATKYGLLPKTNLSDSQRLRFTLFGREFSHPLGIAAGFDKDAEAVDGLFGLGFSFVEVGSVTPEPQEGNEKPRVFRLLADNAVINRYGFNSCGHAAALENLKMSISIKTSSDDKKSNNNHYISDKRNQLNANFGIFGWKKYWNDKINNDKGFYASSRFIGVNLGKNKLSSDALADYCKGVMCFGNLVSYVVINVSSPNTPGLRELQKKEELTILLQQAKNHCLKLEKKPLLFVKISPDLSHSEVEDICNIITSERSRVDAVIISNTTCQRPDSLEDANKSQTGGLSGAPLKSMSTKLISKVYRLTQGSIPIVGVGGIFTGEDAFEKIAAGASLLQIYTSFVYQGPPVIGKICRELDLLLMQKGYQSVPQAVGCSSKD